MDLNAWLAETRLVVCVGSGGVGKTTTAAAIGLWGALQGRKAIVLTIDPAKRLANSLGLDEMGGEPTRIDLSALPEATGELWAMMLDSRGTFDALIHDVAPSAKARDRILGNHIYRHMADAFAGSQDYMATEKLYDLSEDGRWDLLVLDTPPVKNALDFLESPGRVVRFLDDRMLSWFTSSYEERGMLGRLFQGGSDMLFRLLGYVFGREFLDDFQEFVQIFGDLYEGFRERHKAVETLLSADDTSFVTVCAPTAASVEVAEFFQIELGMRDLPRGGVIVNQVHHAEAASDDAEAALGAQAHELAEGLPDGTVEALLARLGEAHAHWREVAEAEAAVVQDVRKVAAEEGFLRTVPRFEGQVHDLAALRRVGQALFRDA